jgi:hypothetical protein
MRALLSGVVIVLTGSIVAAQQTSPQGIKRQLEEQQRGLEIYALKERVALEQTVKNAPYSAEVLVESSQTLADGNHINRRSTGRVYRDSDGRVRREEDRSNGTVGISIVDPVAGVSYSLDPDNRIAWKTPTTASEAIMKKAEAIRKEQEVRERSGSTQPVTPAEEQEFQLKREAERAAATVAAGRIGRATAVEEHQQGPLERKTLEGVAVTGRRSTTTIKAGAIGNDLPITITSEEWTSPDLSVLVMTHRNDPRMGESSYRLTNIVRAEPDGTLFQVPADYMVRDTGIKRNFVER